jgi:hypothetical protein
MYLNLGATIELGYPNPRVIKRIIGIELYSTWREIGERCRITLPRYLSLASINQIDTDEKIVTPKKTFGVQDLEQQKTDVNGGVSAGPLAFSIELGTPIVVRLGYDNITPELPIEFVGYVSRVSPGTPTIIDCEDISYWLKRNSVESKFFKGPVKLRALLDHVLKNLSTRQGPLKIDLDTAQLTDADFGTYQFIDKPTVFQALNEIRRTTGLAVYFRQKDAASNPKLYIGLPYQEYNRAKPLGSNSAADVILSLYGDDCNVIGSSLEWLNRETNPVQVIAKSNYKGADKRPATLVVKYPDTPDANQWYDKREIPMPPGISDPKVLLERAKREYAVLAYTGYRGTLTCFGLPRLQHNMAVEIRNELLPFVKNPAVYMVDGVRKQYGTGGIRQTVELGMAVEVGNINAFQSS